MKSMLPSELDTARMRLHKIGPADFEHLAALWADPQIAEHTSLSPLDEAQSSQTLAAHIEHWSIQGFGLYCAFDKLSNDFIGTLGLTYPPARPEPEYSAALRPRFWGGRYGVEGGRRFIELAQRDLGWSTLVSLVRRGDEKSIRGLTRLGAKFDRSVDLLGDEWVMYRLFQNAEVGLSYGPSFGSSARLWAPRA